MVWRVCRQHLRQEQDAEDAFQATFLVLARKAGSIRKSKALANWLFGVARRTALLIYARTDHPREAKDQASADPDPSTMAGSAELCDLILDAVRRLPEKYRVPLLLCGVQGATKAEAARQLGWKEGTLAGRLARARQLLERRLLRRGIAVPSGAMLAGIAVPSHLHAYTLQALRSFMSQLSVPANAPVSARIAREVLQPMYSLFKTLALSSIVLGLAAAGVGGLLYHRLTDTPIIEQDAKASVVAETPLGQPGMPRWQECLRLRGFEGHAYHSFSPDSRLMGIVNGRSVLEFLDTATWQSRGRCDLKTHPDGGLLLLSNPYSPDGRFFVVQRSLRAGPGQAKARAETSLIDVASAKIVAALPGSNAQFSPAGKLLATCLDDTLSVWDYASATLIRKLLAGGKVKWQGDWFSPDGKLLFAPTAKGTGKLWEVATGEEVATVRGFHPVWSKDGATLVTFLPGGKIKIWDVPTATERATLSGFNMPGCTAQFSPDSKLLMTSVLEFGLKDDGETDYPKGPQPYVPKKLPVDVRLWDAQTGKQLVRFPGKTQFGRSGQFSPDGKMVAFQRLSDGPGYTMEVVLWDVAAGKERLVIRDKQGIDGLQFTPDGLALTGLVGPHGQAVLCLWDVNTGRRLPSIGGQELSLIDFAPDGKTFVASVMVRAAAEDVPPEGIPARMELQVFSWTDKSLVLETRGEPTAAKPRKAAPPPSEASRALSAIQKESEAAESAFAERFKTCKTEAERQPIQKERLTRLAQFVEQAIAVARKYPEAPESIEALEFALRCTAGGFTGRLGDLGNEAVVLIRQGYLMSPALDRLLPWLRYHYSEAADNLLELAFEKSAHRLVRGRAAYWLASGLADAAEAAILLRQMPSVAEAAAPEGRQENVQRLRAINPVATSQRAEKLFVTLGREYADIKISDIDDDALGYRAERALFALRHLAVGKASPDIEGADLNGKKFGLSEYRGKVVVLIFCGHWCGPCREMNRHKQAMVKRLADKPFTLLEVNSDQDPDNWEEIMKQEGYTWRCWADGSREGPIARKWNVTRWPTVFVLDGKGVIRYKDLRDKPLEEAVDTLLREMGP